MEAKELGGRKTNRLQMKDLNSGSTFLIDTGAELSVLPKPDDWQGEPLNIKLHAANSTPINVYDFVYRTIQFPGGKPLTWVFYVADVASPILGSDALVHFRLLVDLAGKKLVSSAGESYGQGEVALVESLSIKTISDSPDFETLLNDYPTVTGKQDPLPVPKEHKIYHYIETTGPPRAQKARKLAPHKLKAAKAEFEKLCRLGLARPSRSPWASPIHLVPKGESYRITGDYRQLNACTKPDKYPVKRLMDFTSILHGTKIYSTLDLKRAFNQIDINPDDVEKTAVITPFGLFEYTAMCFGLSNAAQTFQRYADTALGDLWFVFVYIDDILIASRTLLEHLKHLKIVLDRLKVFGLQLNLAKCVIAKPLVTFLGFDISEQGYKPTTSRVQVILNYPKPQLVKDLRRFIGILNYYRLCTPKAAHSQYHLLKFLKDSKKNDKTVIPWDEAAEKTFEQCKEKLAKISMLTFPDAEAEIRLVTDASDFAMGGVLEQKTKSQWKPLGFFSRKFEPAQQKYATYDRELLAIVESVKHFSDYLEDRSFEICTDHKPIIYSQTLPHDKAPAARVRKISYLSQFDIKYSHVKGEDNTVADALSRISTISLTNEKNQNEIFLLNTEKSDPEIAAIRFPRIFDEDTLMSEQAKDPQLKELLKDSNHPLSLQKYIWGPTQKPIYCNVNDRFLRPYIPASLRHKIIKLFHSNSHPGNRVTHKLVSQYYVWPNMSRDIASYCRTCLQCQTSKISRHNQTKPAHFDFPDAKLQYIHIDIVGPLPVSGYKYTLTMVDRYARWPEAIPMYDMTAESCARAFYEHWISRFGAPELITTDQGKQFESCFLNELFKIMVMKRIRTTSYHPPANGMVEKWHRHLKASLMCVATSTDWYSTLPTVLLGLRTAIRLDTGFSPAEMLFGQPLRIPGDFCDTSNPNVEVGTFMNEYQKHLQQLKPVPVPHKRKKMPPQYKPFYYKDLATCTHVLRLVKKVKPPLTRPYTGPHKVISRHHSNKYFKILVKGKPKIISTDHLKPAYFNQEDLIDRFPEFATEANGAESKQTSNPTPETQNDETETETQPVGLEENPTAPTKIQETGQTVTHISQLPRIKLPSNISLNIRVPRDKTNSNQPVNTDLQKKVKTKLVPNILRSKKVVFKLGDKTQ